MPLKMPWPRIPVEPKPIDLVRSSYQPKKAELEEDVRLPEDGGPITMEEFEEIGRALVQSVNVTRRDKPKN